MSDNQSFPDHRHVSAVNRMVTDHFKANRKRVTFDHDGIEYTLGPADCRRLIVGAWGYLTDTSKGIDPTDDGTHERSYPIVDHYGRRGKDPLNEAGLLVPGEMRSSWDNSREINDLGMAVAEYLFDTIVATTFTFQEALDHQELLKRQDAERREALLDRRRKGWGPITDARGTLVGQMTVTCFSQEDMAWIGDQIATLRANRETTVERVINRVKGLIP